MWDGLHINVCCLIAGICTWRAALLLFFRRRTHPGFNSGAAPSMATLATATAQYLLNIYSVSTIAADIIGQELDNSLFTYADSKQTD